ncbi:MAG: glycosyltransferase family 2 protein [Anaerolineae bacterium]
MDLSVIIVSHNTRELLALCLDSLLANLASSALGYEVIVVDNASRDRTVEMVLKRFPQVQLLANEENLGFAAANNQGLKESKGNYLLLLNPDTLVQGEALQLMFQFLVSHPRVSLVGPKLLYSDGRLQHSAFSFPTLLMIFLDFFPLNHRFIDSRLNGRYPKALYEAGEPFAVDHPLGAAMMVRRETVDQVGPLDEGFFIYCEEIDWCMRMKKMGWEIFCLPQAEIVHYVGKSTGQFREAMYVELHRSRYRLYEKHHGPAFRLMSRLIVGLGVRREMLKARREARQGKVAEGKLEKRLDAYRQVLELS